MIQAEIIVVGTANMKPMLHAKPSAIPLPLCATELLQFGHASKMLGEVNRPAKIRMSRTVFAKRDLGIRDFRMKEGTTNKDKDTQALR